MKLWKDISKDRPPIDRPIWGFSLATMEVSKHQWDGQTFTQNGDPFPAILAKTPNAPITHWMEKEIDAPRPEKPNVKLYLYD